MSKLRLKGNNSLCKIFSIATLLGFLAGNCFANSPVQKISSSLPSVDDAISAIYVSAPEKNKSEALPKLLFKEDLVSVEVDAINELIDDTTIPNSEKSIQLVRYTLGDSRVTAALKRAKKEGITVSVVTDLNPVMEGNFSTVQGETTSAFSKAKLKDPEKSPGAKVIQELLEAGFELKKDIHSQPLYRPERERVPIMHEKALLLKSGKDKVVFFGTANLAANPRYNRTFKVLDPVFYDRYEQHLKLLREGYEKGKESSELESEPRTLIRYGDGTELEMAFTSSNYNPNDRIAEILKTTTLNHIDLSHFVITHRGFLKALGEAISKNPEATGFAVADDRFAAVKGWGLSPALAGVDVLDPYNRKVTGLTPSAFDRIESFVYQRPAVDPQTGKLRVERSENGPPVARHVWHDKTTLIDFTDPDGKLRTALFSGSFNLSNNIANSEFQAQFNLSRDSWIRKAVKHSIQEVVSNEPQWAVPTLEATLRNAMALLLGVTDIEIPLKKNAELLNAIDKRDFESMRKIIKEMSHLETQLNWKLPQEDRVTRVNQLIKFLHWYEKNVPPSNAELEVRTQRTIGMALVIAQPQLQDHVKATILSKVLDRAQVSATEHHKLLNGAFRELGLGEINPWSGQISRFISFEDIVSENLIKELKSATSKTLTQEVLEKVNQGDMSWKGPSFDFLISSLESEIKSSGVSIFSSGQISQDEIGDFLELLKARKKELGISAEMFIPLKSHIIDTADQEKLEDRIQKLLESQAKKGMLSSQVQSSDPNLLSVLNKIKRNQEGALAEFTIKLPPKTNRDQDSYQNCNQLIGTLGR